MEQNRERPAGSATRRGEKSLYVVETDEDSINLSKRQRKVLNLLMRGKFSATDITIALGFCDPRSYIKALRHKGFNILDEWVETDDTRFKRYFI